MGWDLQLTADGDLPIRQVLITGDALTAQRIKVRYQQYAGDWILDVGQGLPWITWLGKKTSLETMSPTLRTVLATTPGVDTVTDWTSKQSGFTFTFTGSATLVEGGSVSFQIGPSIPINGAGYSVEMFFGAA